MSVKPLISFCSSSEGTAKDKINDSLNEISGGFFSIENKQNMKCQSGCFSVSFDLAHWASVCDDPVNTAIHNDCDELVSRAAMLARVNNNGERNHDLEKIISSIAMMLDSGNDYTKGHNRRVADLAVSIGRLFGMPENELEVLWIGGMLHDIGKLTISSDILNKPGRLDDDEKAVMRMHAHSGYMICHKMKNSLSEVLSVIRHHHEHLDGSGYPDRLRGDEISLSVRIMAVVDIYDALTVDRPYRKAVGTAEALNVLDSMSGKCWIDPVVVDMLRQSLSGGESS